MNTDPASVNQAIEHLRQNWERLSPLERIQPVADIMKSGISKRQLADRVEHSDSAIRNLLIARHAPPADLAAAREGSIRFAELLRRAKAEIERRAKRAQENTKNEQERQADQRAKFIIDWLHQQNISGPYAEQVIGDVRTKLAWDEEAGLIPHMLPPPGFPIETIIARCKPTRSAEDDGLHNLGWHVEWLARWLVCAFPDSHDRYLAMECALRLTERRN
jgi:hypothetical protein